MSPRYLVALAAALLVTPSPAPAAQAPAVSHGSAASHGAPASAEAGGIEWKVPARWKAGAGSAMRVATYAVPAAKGEEAGECAVFFFGPGQGGDVESNVQRWGRQFEGTPKPDETTATVAGMRVTRAAVAGTYLAPGGPMMQSQGKKAGYRLLGAIVEGPQGNVFFKLTGPAASVAAAEADFDALVASLRKE
jgi:hypothetical protein